ncbi:MAG: GDSL family lipase [Chloroflexi bacterium CFX4]|nr:GDSL family lipase [Chloroflexi bacterium CFX4]MDL1921128.1 GDSL family lipase [Chloroflexi bacterium CFX3]
MIFGQHHRIVFMGDSITDADRRGAAAPYGNGYVNTVRNFMIARYPQHNLTFINKGVGGDTVRQLAMRWEADVIRERSQWVSVMIGANDVWRHFTYNAREAVPVGEFQSTLRALLQRARQAIKANFVLMQPYAVIADVNHPMRQLMALYGGVVEGLAVEFGAALVRTQAAFDQAMQSLPESFWSPDQIHVGAQGHTLLAQAWLRAVGYDF